MYKEEKKGEMQLELEEELLEKTVIKYIDLAFIGKFNV